MAFGGGTQGSLVQQNLAGNSPAQQIAAGQGKAFAQANSPYNVDYNAGMTYNKPQFDAINWQNSMLNFNNNNQQQDLALQQQQTLGQYAGNLSDLQTQQGQNQISLQGAQRQPGLIDQLLASQNRQFDIQRQQLGTNIGQQTRQLNSDATARGAYNAGGTKDDRRTLYEQLSEGLGNIGENQQQNTLSQTEQKAQANDRISQLNLQAKNFGVKADQLKSMLDIGLQRLGLQGTVNSGNLLDGLVQNDLQAKQLMNQIAQQAGLYATARGQQ